MSNKMFRVLEDEKMSKMSGYKKIKAGCNFVLHRMTCGILFKSAENTRINTAIAIVKK